MKLAVNVIDYSESTALANRRCQGNSAFSVGKYHLDLTRPQVMGVLNVTPDSFYVKSRVDRNNVLSIAEAMLSAGAGILDIGGEATQPNANSISEQEELDRVIPIVEQLTALPVPLSVDTSRASVMRAAIAKGASMINDVRALCWPGALAAVAEYPDVAVCLMHQQQQASANLLQSIQQFWSHRIEACVAAGIATSRIMLDPGLGAGSFGKTTGENLQLLKELSSLQWKNFPLLVGISRKIFIGECLNLPAEQRLFGSLGGACWAYLHGASIIRTHDVAETVQALGIIHAIHNS